MFCILITIFFLFQGAPLSFSSLSNPITVIHGKHIFNFRSRKLKKAFRVFSIYLINFCLCIQRLLDVDFMAHKVRFLDEQLINRIDNSITNSLACSLSLASFENANVHMKKCFFISKTFWEFGIRGLCKWVTQTFTPDYNLKCGRFLPWWFIFHELRDLSIYISPCVFISPRRSFLCKLNDLPEPLL